MMLAQRIAISVLCFLPCLVEGQQMGPMQGMSMPAATAPVKMPALTPLAAPVDLLGELSSRPALDLQSFLAKALTANPAVAQSRAVTTRTEAIARQASLYPNPSIGYQGDQIRGGSFGGGEQGGYIAQTIPLGGKLALRRKAVEAEAMTSRSDTETQMVRVRTDVTKAFYSALSAQESARLRRQLFDVAQDAVRTARQLANVGQADAPDLLTAEVEQEQAEIADEYAQRLFLGRFHSLAVLAGVGKLQPTRLQGDLAATPPAQTAASVDRIIETSPLVQQARAEIAAAEARLLSARRENVPDLQLKAGEQYNFEQLGSTPTSRASSTRVGPQAFASASLTLPIWNRNQGNIAAAVAEVEGARQELRRVQQELQSESAPLLETYTAANAQAERYRVSILPRASRAAQLYEQKYNQMAQAYPQVIVSRRTLLELQLRYLESVAAVWQSFSTLEGGILGGSVLPASRSAGVPMTRSGSLE